MPDYGASEFGGGATAGEAAAGLGESGAITTADITAADTAAAAGTDFGATAGTAGTLAGGTGEFATGVTAGDLATTGAGTGATLASPGILDQIQSAYQAASPYFDTAKQILNTVNMLRGAQSGAGTPARGAANTPSSAPLATSTPASQNQMTRDDYIKQQEAYWQNLLAAQGNNLPGNQLPPNIQDMIRRQSSLYPA